MLSKTLEERLKLYEVLIKVKGRLEFVVEQIEFVRNSNGVGDGKGELKRLERGRGSEREVVRYEEGESDEEEDDEEEEEKQVDEMDVDEDERLERKKKKSRKLMVNPFNDEEEEGSIEDVILGTEGSVTDGMTAQGEDDEEEEEDEEDEEVKKFSDKLRKFVDDEAEESDGDEKGSQEDDEEIVVEENEDQDESEDE
jgi:U3 small nucleolar RNA-associated protein 5